MLYYFLVFVDNNLSIFFISIRFNPTRCTCLVLAVRAEERQRGVVDGAGGAARRTSAGVPHQHHGHPQHTCQQWILTPVS